MMNKDKLESKYKKDIKYWQNNDRDLGGGQKKMIQYIIKYIEENGTLHELGCGPEAPNLKALSGERPNLIMTGNDINKRTKGKRLLIENTIDWVQRQPNNSYDYILTCAHLIHISNLWDDLLATEIPRVAKKYIFCYENNSPKPLNEPIKAHKYWRDYRDFFQKTILIEEINGKNIHSPSYSLYIFEVKE